jgi:hypothetical protein
MFDDHTWFHKGACLQKPVKFNNVLDGLSMLATPPTPVWCHMRHASAGLSAKSPASFRLLMLRFHHMTFIAAGGQGVCPRAFVCAAVVGVCKGVASLCTAQPVLSQQLWLRTFEGLVLLHRQTLTLGAIAGQRAGPWCCMACSLAVSEPGQHTCRQCSTPSLAKAG